MDALAGVPSAPRRTGGVSRRARLASALLCVSLAMGVLVILEPTPASATSFHLFRTGSFATGSAVKSVGISADGRWAVAGSLTGAIRLFDLDADPLVPVWTSANINVVDAGIRGSSHSVSISRDGMFISAGTGQTSVCENLSWQGCVFLFRRDGGGVPLWNRTTNGRVISTDVTDAYVAVSGTLAVFDFSGNVYWGGGVPSSRVDLTSDGRYLASAGRGYAVDLYENTGAGFSLLWSFDTTARAGSFVNIDLAENGKGLAVGEEDVFDTPQCCDAYQFYPASGQWTMFDRSPCMTIHLPNDVTAVAVAGESSVDSGERMITGGVFGGVPSTEYAYCSSTPASTWATGYALSADATRAGCSGSAPCFSVFGGYDRRVYLGQEGDAAPASDVTGGEVNTIAMSDEVLPRIVAGSDDGSVYFYQVLSDAVDYIPWQPSPAAGVRVGVNETIVLSSGVKNIGGKTPLTFSTIAFQEQGSPSPFHTEPVGVLPAGVVSQRFEASWTAPSAPGRHRVDVIVDYGNALPESDETNNVYTFVLNVTALPITTLVVGSPQVAGPPTYVTTATPLSFSVLDQGGTGIRNTTYRVDRGPWVNFTATGPFTLAVEGAHTVEWFSEDFDGNVEPIANATLRVDTTPPGTTLTVGAPKYEGAETFVTSAAPLTLAATDGGVTPVGLAAMEYRVWRGTWTGWTLYASLFRFTGLDGLRFVEYRSADRLGNQETIRNATLVLDDTPPTTTISPSVGPFGAGSVFTLAATDDGSGVARTEYRVDGGVWIPYNGGFSLAAGDHAIGYRSADHLNNTEVERTLAVTAASPPPTAEVNWKPLVAAVFSAILAIAGAWASRRRPWKGGTGRRAILAAFGIASAPFVLAEAATGIVSYATGLLTLPPILGAGTAVDVGILAVGVSVAVLRTRRGTLPLTTVLSRI